MAEKLGIMEEPVIGVDVCCEENANMDDIVKNSFPDIQKALRQLDPSQELEYYRKKMDDLVMEVQDFNKEIDRCQAITLYNHELEKDLIKQTSNSAKLQKLVSDLQGSLCEAQEQILYLYSENEKLKVEARENKNMISRLPVTSNLAFGTRTIVTKTCRGVPRSITQDLAVQCQKESEDDVDQEQIIEPGDSSPCCGTHRCLKLFQTIEKLKEEYASHLQFIAKDKEISRMEADSLRIKLQKEVDHLSERLKESNNELYKSVKEHMQWREASRLQEVSTWSQLQNTQSVMDKKKNQGYGTEDTGRTLPGGGTDATSGQEIDVSSFLSEINFLKEEITVKNNLIEKYQNDCVTLQDELAAEKSKAGRENTRLKDLISKAIESIERYKMNYKYLERRRMVELNGFHSAIRLIRSRVRDLERHYRRVNHSVFKLMNLPMIPSKKYTSAVNDTVASADTLRKGIQEARTKIDDVEEALYASK